MSHLGGVFEDLADLEQIPIEDIRNLVTFPIEQHILENFVANRMLYPQSVPMNEYEMEIDLAILKAVILKNPKLVYNELRSTITIKKELVVRFPPVSRLLLTLSGVLPLKEKTKIYEKDWAQTRLVGTLLCPVTEEAKVTAEIGGKHFNLSPQSFTHIPFGDRQANAKVNTRVIPDAVGGDWGIFVDLRKR